MAKLAGIDTVEKLANKRFVSLLEPCCGSGANLLAFAEHIADSGKIPSLHMAAVAVDIGCFMCVDVFCAMPFLRYSRKNYTWRQFET